MSKKLPNPKARVSYGVWCPRRGFMTIIPTPDGYEFEPCDGFFAFKNERQASKWAKDGGAKVVRRVEENTYSFDE